MQLVKDKFITNQYLSIIIDIYYLSMIYYTFTPTDQLLAQFD